MDDGIQYFIVQTASFEKKKIRYMHHVHRLLDQPLLGRSYLLPWLLGCWEWLWLWAVMAVAFDLGAQIEDMIINLTFVENASESNLIQTPFPERETLTKTMLILITDWHWNKFT